MLTFTMDAARNFNELSEDTLSERDGTSIQQRTGVIEEENKTSPVSSNGSGGGSSICHYHIIRYDHIN